MSTTYIAKSTGDNTPPCRTPQVIHIIRETTLFQHTKATPLLYQLINNLRKNFGTLRHQLQIRTMMIHLVKRFWNI